MARSVGTLVNRDTTSNETNTSSPDRLYSAIKVVKFFELHMADGDFPTSGDRSWESWSKSWYVGDFTKDAIGLSGTSGLWTFRYSRGVLPLGLRRCSYSLSGMDSFLFKASKFAFFLYSRTGVWSFMISL